MTKEELGMDAYKKKRREYLFHKYHTDAEFRKKHLARQKKYYFKHGRKKRQERFKQDPKFREQYNEYMRKYLKKRYYQKKAGVEG